MEKISHMKIHDIFISIAFVLVLCSCESVKSLEGLVTDSNNVPLDSVLVSDNLRNQTIFTDSLGRFKYMRIGPVRQGLDIKFNFSKQVFISYSQTIKVNEFSKVVVVMNKDTTE